MSAPSRMQVVYCLLAALALACGLDALSYRWQFGYVSQRLGIGLRQGQLYYFSREDPVIPSLGFYMDDADKVNIVIGNSGSPTTRWGQVGVKPWLLSLSLTGTAAIGLTVPASGTHGRRRRKLRVALATFAFACGLLWLISENVRWVFLRGNVYVLLTGGCVEVAVAHDSRYFDVLRRNQPTRLSFANHARIPRLSLLGSIPNGRLPLWIPFMLALPPLFTVLSRGALTGQNHCRECEYDLTGNISGICPECGTKCPDVKPSKTQFTGGS